MMKLLPSLRSSRKQLSEKLLFGKAGDAKNAVCLHAFASQAGISTANQNFAASGKNSERIYVKYSIYKGKSALCVNPILPTFSKVDSAGGSGGLRISRRGALMLEFASACGERKYDWEKKQMFALSATEMGSLMSMGPKDSCEFFHDPSMQSSNSGQIRKSLSIKPQDTGYFVSLSVVNNILKTNERIAVPVSTAEFAVLKTACIYVLPHILGWARYTSQTQTPSLEGSSTKMGSDFLGSSTKTGSDFLEIEWDK